MTELERTAATAAASPESGFNLIDALIANLKDAEKGISRGLILITVLSAFFIILARHQVGVISFDGIPISNHYFVQAFLPIMIAALYLSTVNTMQMAIELIKDLDRVATQFRSQTDRAYGERLLWPSTGAFAALAALPVLLESRSARLTTTIGSWTRYLLYLLAPIGMIFYACWFLLSHTPGPLQYTAVLISVAIIVQPMILLFSIVPAIRGLSAGHRTQPSSRASAQDSDMPTGTVP